MYVKRPVDEACCGYRRLARGPQTNTQAAPAHTKTQFPSGLISSQLLSGDI